ncbi:MULTISPECIES: helix-turn-helix domain-containing protein [unclassified Saccharopolyspora]|uniref:helix-turn-helix domain-containing protein n=1 Tax=unclassified Saccharopolyspora TaxID=2646250 RepID=UPI001CD51697|nr:MULTISPECIES: helix-turn-helix domain-containing protein [unclassified Saccharopolyspora]MCA1192889.1 helix-turn-helix domain-containing protein [Saccharopolyspora sp. 6V]MCA1229408.1 helix-turn-helix domain-containing protein [Saccharopolyspora sp. 6M]
MRGEDAAGHGHSVFVARLRGLFDEITYVDEEGRRRRVSNQYVAERTGLSKSYIDGLRNGRNTNPGLNVLTALVSFFNAHRGPDTPPVTVSFLAGDDASPEQDVSLQQQLADRDVRAIAMRAGEASPHQRRQILAMLDALKNVEPDQG